MNTNTSTSGLFDIRNTDLGPDSSLIIARTFGLSDDRVRRISGQIESMDEAEVSRILEETRRRFAGRHRGVDRLFDERAELVSAHAPHTRSWSGDRRRVLGACFLMEYSIASAAVFNPSICPHPDQGGLAAGERRAIVSLRAVGEGHISSVLFREAILGADGAVDIAPADSPLDTGTLGGDPSTGEYEVFFDDGVPLGARTLFPVAPDEKVGLEDVRLVQFADLAESGVRAPDGIDGVASRVRYYGTVTGYDGEHIVPKMIETSDFRRFRIFPLSGAQAANKDMGLFPRKLGGRYWMVGRQDGQRMSIMHSDSIEHWETTELLREPYFDWEIMQIGGCGSPIETNDGWLVPMHGVGPFRRYSIGFYLLDLDDPARVRAVSRRPAIEPADDERDGYVPNVVYTCGAMPHGERLIMPYAVNDTAIHVAVGETAGVIESLVEV